jgi:hypothetical protein
VGKIIKISEKLYQFRDETALVIVAAKQEGRVFRAGNGELELLEKFRVSTPHFSDNEGMSQERGRRENIIEENIHHEYFEHFQKLLHSLAPRLKPTHIYLFAPAHVAGELEKIVKPIFGALTVKTVTGIFTKDTPVEFLERLH